MRLRLGDGHVVLRSTHEVDDQVSDPHDDESGGDSDAVNPDTEGGVFMDLLEESVDLVLQERQRAHDLSFA
mgnify:CR=1 FL=1